MMRYFIVLFVLLFASQVNADRADLSPGWHESHILYDGLQRYYRYYLPDTIKPHPALVLVLHGGARSMRKIFRKRASGTQEWRTLADENGFVLMAPNGVNVETGDAKGDRQNWNDCRVAVAGDNSASQADDAGFIARLLDWAQQQFGIDASRVYLTGASNGGMMSLRLLTGLGNRFAAAAVFIANQPQQTDCAEPRFAVPLMLMNGTDDPLIKWQGGQIRGKGPVLLSTPLTLDYWLRVNHADKQHAVETMLADNNTNDDSRIFKTVYPALEDGQPLWFYRVQGGGHTMPSIKHRVPFIARWLVGNQNRDIEAAREAWRFMQQFRRKPVSEQHL